MGRTTFWLLEQEREAKEKAQNIDWDKEVEKYHNGSGWYNLPGYDKAKRKEEAIEILKESDN